MLWMSRKRMCLRPAVVMAVLALVAALVPAIPVAAAPSSAAETAEGTVIYVDKNADGPGDGSEVDPFNMLGDALAVAGAGDTIMVAAGVYGPMTGEDLPFVVPSYVTIIGEYSDEEGWLTELVGNMVQLQPLIEELPMVPIMTLGSEVVPFEVDEGPQGAEGVVLKDLVFHSNYSDYGAAGLHAYGSQVSVDNCGFFGLMSWAGSAIWAEQSEVTITRSVFAENGGEMYSDRSAAELPFGVDLSAFRLDKLPQRAEGMDAQQFPGANYAGAILSWHSTTAIEDSGFIFNSADQAGGAIITDSGYLSTEGCEFLYNSVGAYLPDSYESGSAEMGDYLSAFPAEIWVEPFGGGAVCALLGEYDATNSYFVLNYGDPGAAVVSHVNDTSLVACGFGMNYGATVVSFDEGVLPGSLSSADYKAAEVEPEPEPAPEIVSGLDIDRSMFYDNYGIFTVYSTEASSRLTNSEFIGNESLATVDFEGAMEANATVILPEPEPEPDYEFNGSVEGCTFTQNYADYALVVGPIYDPMPLVNTIIWDNGDEEWQAMWDATNVEAYNVDYENDLDAVFEVDCFSEDPMFAFAEEWDVRLSAGSPCIDTGTSAPEVPEFETTEMALAWELRPWDVRNLGRPSDGDGDGIALFDVGAHEYLGSERVGGPERFATSVEISKRFFGQSDVVVIATGRVFADGLAGSGLAGIESAPILLTDPAYLPAVVADEILRLGASKAFILGGPVAVSFDVEEELVELGLEIERIGGVDRYETAAMIAEYLMAGGGMGFAADDGPVTAFIARGDLYADALAVSPIAYGNGIPVLLVHPEELPEHTVDILREMGVDQAVVLGGDVAVSGVVAKGVGALADEVTRISGATRYETAANIATWAKDEMLADFGVTGIATGDDFADALSGGAAIGRTHGVLLLNPSATVDPACKAAVQANAEDIQALMTFGGSSALSDEVYDFYMGLLE